MDENRDTRIKAEVDQVILSLCSHIKSKIEGLNISTICEIAEITTALATLIEARVKLDENASTTDIKSKFVDILKNEMTNYDC